LAKVVVPTRFSATFRSMRSSFLLCSVATLLLLSSPASAAPRVFKATLTKVDTCNFATATGSAEVTIDDQSGAVSGKLTIAGFTDGATVSQAAIVNTAAGNNVVGEFTGVNQAAPNATHDVTTTLNAAALTPILAGKGAVLIRANLSGSGCGNGALQGPLTADGSSAADAGITDAGTSSNDAAATPVPVTQPVPATGGTDGGSPVVDAGAGNAAAPADEGCNTSGSAPTGSVIFGMLGLLAVRAASRRRTRRG
jgi:hypothetical protein